MNFDTIECLVYVVFKMLMFKIFSLCKMILLKSQTALDWEFPFLKLNFQQNVKVSNSQ